MQFQFFWGYITIQCFDNWPRVRWLCFPAALARETLNSLVLFLWAVIPCDQHTVSPDTLKLFGNIPGTRYKRVYSQKLQTNGDIFLLSRPTPLTHYNLCQLTPEATRFLVLLVARKMLVKCVNTPTCGTSTSLRRCCQKPLHSFTWKNCSVQASAWGKGALMSVKFNLLPQNSTHIEAGMKMRFTKLWIHLKKSGTFQI